MSFLHDASVECTLSELDIFDIPPTQTSIEKFLFVEVQPIAALSDNAPLEFFISGSDDYYYDLNNTLLYINCCIVKQDNSAIAAGARVAVINYPLATLFNQIDITLGDRVISQSNNLYSYSAGHHNDRSLDGSITGFVKIAVATAHLKPLDLLGLIFMDIFNQPKLILNGLDLKVQLTRNKDVFCLMPAEAEPLKVQITQAALYVKRVQVSPAVQIGHSQALLSATAKCAIDRTCLKVYSMAAGTRTTNYENLFLGQIPKTLILGFVDNEAFSGSYAKNPLMFHHYNVSHATLYLDGLQIPAQPYNPNFNVDLAIKEYMALAHTSGKQKADCAMAIDREEFMDGFTLMAFDLLLDQEPGGHFSLIKHVACVLKSDLRYRPPIR
ncbi:uncharacterized protein F54H12.2-like [Dendrobates tinctorius]|uniref:uncharacterized protein F54H12.2-like n=1 Tax=Dendrobates tinctorius TaxID=92724 RepID=UPI003CCA0A76